jgi:hypothetical protein
VLAWKIDFAISKTTLKINKNNEELRSIFLIWLNNHRDIQSWILKFCTLHHKKTCFFMGKLINFKKKSFLICIFLKNSKTRVRLICVYNKNLKKNRWKILHASIAWILQQIGYMRQFLYWVYEINAFQYFRKDKTKKCTHITHTKYWYKNDQENV